jgi:hypothetical protein
MSVPGVGAMIGYLSGNEATVAAYKDSLGKKITEASIDNDGNGGDGLLRLGFEDGSTISIFDNGRSCCESRYMTCDDDLVSIVGGRLLKIETKEAPEQRTDWGYPHEIEFLQVQTDAGAVTLSTHNEHNGYYGGFNIVIEKTA